MKMIKMLGLAGICAAGALTLCGAENLMRKPEVSYQVFPGDWYKGLENDKNLGKFIDPDLDRATGKRKGLLADGNYAQRGVCYNYHWTKKDFRFVTVVIDLGKEYDLSKVRIVAFQNNEAYKPGLFEVAVSSDNVVFTDAAKGDSWQTQKRYQRIADAELTAAKGRYVRVKVSTASTWINLAEIEVFDK